MSKAVSAPLSPTEKQILTEYEAVIERGKNTFVEVGHALLEIRDKRLYREKFKTFEDYCQIKWQFNRQRGAQLINAAIEVTSLPPELSTMVNNERAARALAEVPAENKAEVVREAATTGAVTSGSIAKAAEKVAEAKNGGKPEVPVDATGYPIPEPALTYWNRAIEVAALLKEVSNVKCAMERAIDMQDIMYGEINFSTLITDLKSSYSGLKVAVPYAVCPTCSGRVLSPCATCKGRGVVSEFYWKHKVPEKTKQVRAKAVALLNSAK